MVGVESIRIRFLVNKKKRMVYKSESKKGKRIDYDCQLESLIRTS